MKIIILAFFILSGYSSFSQKQKEVTDESVKTLYTSLPKIDGKYEYTEVIQLDTAFKKDMLYKNSKLFFADIFKSAKDVLQYDGNTILEFHFKTLTK